MLRDLVNIITKSNSMFCNLYVTKYFRVHSSHNLFSQMYYNLQYNYKVRKCAKIKCTVLLKISDLHITLLVLLIREQFQFILIETVLVSCFKKTQITVFFMASDKRSCDFMHQISSSPLLICLSVFKALNMGLYAFVDAALNDFAYIIWDCAHLWVLAELISQLGEMDQETQ